jgi:hypothetical protein
MKRSAYWEEVTTLVERSREACAAFDPAADDATAREPLAEGVRPILRLYVRSRREGEPLSAVEESLLEGALNDWLDHYAACHETVPDDHVTLHEAAMEYAESGSLRAATRTLVGVDAEDPAAGTGTG